MGKVFITSDWHFCHDREFIYKPRGFSSVEKMNEEIIARYNEVVSDDDDVYVLGDLMLGDTEKGLECVRRLKGRLHVVLGNHDTDSRIHKYEDDLPNVVEITYATKIKYKKFHFFMAHFPAMTGNLENENLAQMTLDLFGHTHSSSKFYNDIPYMYNVAVDAHNCYPVDLDEVIKDMKEKVEECKSFL